MSHQFLSDEWIEAAREIRHKWADRVPEVPLLVRINVVATKVPFGEGTIHAHIDSSTGRLEMELGALENPDLTITTDYDTARQLFVAQDPAASMQAFMAGRIKVEGDITKMMLMQTAVPQTPETLEVSEEIRRITT
ncbi:MAG: SCP2 sterol-binding domain-containing protein [Actinobacteria bacterium]|nr:SCP2 sterol-binding domain-containing protein [Actinomycetota bacterium]